MNAGAWGMPEADYMVLCLKLHVETHHVANQNCYDQNCAGHYLLRDHPDNWARMTVQEITSWAELRR